MKSSGALRIDDRIPAFTATLLILAVAVALFSPELITGLSRSDSYRYNIAWTAQFRDLVRAGDFYPRWLPWSWAGLGSPTFYFYPPLFFWFAALIDALSLHALQLETLISLTSAMVLACSGLAMNSWLRLHAAPKVALVGALAYMAAPYHVFDLYLRGALAESCAYAIIPLAALTIRQLADGHDRAVFLFAGTYAGLTLAHLPSALLASLFLISPYAVFCAVSYAKSPVRFFALLAVSALAGIGMAACYLLPAIGLLPFISAEKLAGPYFLPAPWFFWNPGAWPFPAVMLLIIPLTLSLLLVIAGTAWPRKGRLSSLEGGFWAAVVVACALMISGMIPQLWQLALLERVQFPWRLLVIGEFAAITCVAASTPLRRNFAVVVGVGLLCYCLAVNALLIGRNIRVVTSGFAVSEADVRRDNRDAPEYLPPGFPVPIRPDGVPEPTRITLPAGPDLVATAAGAKVQTMRREKGGLDVIVKSPVSTDLIARRFYFPSWRVIDQHGNRVATAPNPSHLLSWRAPAGQSSFAVRNGAAPGERLGLWVSLGTLLVLLGAAAVLALARARRPGDTFDNRR